MFDELLNKFYVDMAGVGSGVYGKARYVETGSRSSRGGRGGPPTGAMPTAQDLQQSQGDPKSDTAGTDGNLHSGRQSKEDEEPDALLPQPSVTEDRKKQEGPYWHEQGIHLLNYNLPPVVGTS